MGIFTYCKHLFLCIHYLYGIYMYVWKVPAPPDVQYQRDAFGGVFKYLTFLDMLLQCIYFFIAFVNDIFGSATLNKRKSTILQRIRDYLFATVAFPVGMFVTCTFWTLYFIDRDYIYPLVYDTFFPRWLNHNIHSAPMIGVFIELWSCPHKYPSLTKGFTTVMGVIVTYALWVCLAAYKDGFWVYPILDKLNNLERLIFVLLSSVSLSVCYVLGHYLNSVIWNYNAKQKLKMD